MELSIYLNKRVQIVLINGFTYIGKVTSTDQNSITIIDKTGSTVCLKESSIDLIKELLQ